MARTRLEVLSYKGAIRQNAVTIRPLRANEVDKLIILWKEFMGDTSVGEQPIPTHEANTKLMTEFVTTMVTEDPRQVLVAEEGGELVGYLIFQRQAQTRTPLQLPRSWSYISDLYVKPSHRRRGIARSLLQTCLNDLRSSGATYVRLSVWSENPNAIRLYRLAGFKNQLLIMETELKGGIGNLR